MVNEEPKRKVWRTDRAFEKFTDIISPETFAANPTRRHLPNIHPYRPSEGTPELEMRRSADNKFKIKKA